MAYIDPLSRDLVLTASRDVRRVDNPTLEHLILRLMTHRGSCFWDATFGSTLHLLAAEKIGPAVERDVEDRARAALQPMLDAREISNLSAKAARVDRNRVELAVRAVDAARRPLSWTMWVVV